KQQNNLIAGLRATNEMLTLQDHPEDKHKDSSLDRESEGEPKEIETARIRPNKKGVVIPRSDSVGSGSGRKYLAPTLSDPAVRTDKERAAATKKRNSRPQSKQQNNLPHLTEGPECSHLARDISANKTALPKVSSVLLEVRDWWHEQLGYNTQSSDEETV
ncbi:hypothetical protein L9F63_018976, partial [Diploptera punctata]